MRTEMSGGPPPSLRIWTTLPRWEAGGSTLAKVRFELLPETGGGSREGGRVVVVVVILGVVRSGCRLAIDVEKELMGKRSKTENTARAFFSCSASFFDACRVRSAVILELGNTLAGQIQSLGIYLHVGPRSLSSFFPSFTIDVGFGSTSCSCKHGGG